MRLAVAPAVAAASSIIVLAALLLPGGGAAAQSTTTIAVGDFYFCDSSFLGGVCETTVSEDDTVEWQFASEFPHTTTACADDHDTCSAPHLWDSPFQDSGSFSYTFDAPGTYIYRCEVHPIEMRGQITVVAAAPASPEASPEAIDATVTPAPTSKAVAGVGAIPSGGGAPGSGGGEPWWLALAGGGALIAAGALLAVSIARRRGA